MNWTFRPFFEEVGGALFVLPVTDFGQKWLKSNKMDDFGLKMKSQEKKSIPSLSRPDPDASGRDRDGIGTALWLH